MGSIDKLCYIKDVPINSILKNGLEIILSLLNADNLLPNEFKKVRAKTLFQQLADGTQYIKNLAGGTVDQCTAQLQHLNLYHLIKIRLNQPVLYEVPESLMSHFRFMRGIDQAIFEQIVNYLTDKNPLSYINQVYSSDDKKRTCVSSKKRFGKDIILAFGLYYYLKTNDFLNKNTSEDINHIWWRLILEIPNTTKQFSTSTKEKSPKNIVKTAFSSTVPTYIGLRNTKQLLNQSESIDNNSSSYDRNDRLAKGRRSIQHARSLSVEAARKTIEEAGTTLINVFLLLPTFILTTNRPSNECIYLSEESDWVSFQTMGSLSTVAESANIKCNILKLLPDHDLSQFLRPSDASYAIRTELASRLKNRTNTISSKQVCHTKPLVLTNVHSLHEVNKSAPYKRSNLNIFKNIDINSKIPIVTSCKVNAENESESKKLYNSSNQPKQSPITSNTITNPKTCRTSASARSKSPVPHFSHLVFESSSHESNKVQKPQNFLQSRTTSYPQKISQASRERSSITRTLSQNRFITQDSSDKSLNLQNLSIKQSQYPFPFLKSNSSNSPYLQVSTASTSPEPKMSSSFNIQNSDNRAQKKPSKDQQSKIPKLPNKQTFSSTNESVLHKRSASLKCISFNEKTVNTNTKPKPEVLLSNNYDKCSFSIPTESTAAKQNARMLQKSSSMVRMSLTPIGRIIVASRRLSLNKIEEPAKKLNHQQPRQENLNILPKTKFNTEIFKLPCKLTSKPSSRLSRHFSITL